MEVEKLGLHSARCVSDDKEDSTYLLPIGSCLRKWKIEKNEKMKIVDTIQTDGDLVMMVVQNDLFYATASYSGVVTIFPKENKFEKKFSFKTKGIKLRYISLYENYVACLTELTDEDQPLVAIYKVDIKGHEPENLIPIFEKYGNYSLAVLIDEKKLFVID